MEDTLGIQECIASLTREIRELKNVVARIAASMQGSGSLGTRSEAPDSPETPVDDPSYPA